MVAAVADNFKNDRRDEATAFEVIVNLGWILGRPNLTSQAWCPHPES
jgi:hypothetical protein